MAWFAGPSFQLLFSAHAFPLVSGLPWCGWPCPAQRVGCTAEEVICSSHSTTHPAMCPGVGFASAWQKGRLSPSCTMAPTRLGAACTGSIPGREGCGLPCHGGLVDRSTLSPQGSRGKERSTKSLLLLPQERPEGKLRFKGQNLTLLDPRACTAQVSARSLDSGVPPPLHC